MTVRGKAIAAQTPAALVCVVVVLEAVVVAVVVADVGVAGGTASVDLVELVPIGTGHVLESAMLSDAVPLRAALKVAKAVPSGS